MRRVAAVSAIILVSLPVIAFGETPRTEERFYATAVGTATVCRATEGAGAPAGAGGTCFDLDGSETSVGLTISDFAGPPVQGYYQFLAADGAKISEGAFCDEGQLPVPSGADTLRVYVDGIIDATLFDGCGAGAAGTVTAVFS